MGTVHTAPAHVALLIAVAGCVQPAVRGAPRERAFARIAVLATAEVEVPHAELASFRGALHRELALLPIEEIVLDARSAAGCAGDPCLGQLASRGRAEAGVRITIFRARGRLWASVRCASPGGHVVCGGGVGAATPPRLARAVANLIATRGELPQVRLRQPIAITASAEAGASPAAARALAAAVGRELALHGVLVTPPDGRGAPELPRAAIRLRLRDDEGLTVIDLDYVIGDGRTVERHHFGTFDAPERLAPVVAETILAVRPAPPDLPRAPAAPDVVEAATVPVEAAIDTAHGVDQLVDLVRLLLCAAAFGRCRP